MGIWIRSQNGLLLINVNYVRMFWENAPENNFGIYGDCHSNDHFLGAYPTEAKAMQVLNMIQDQVEAIEYFKSAGKDRDMPCPPFVFQMPPAGFSENGGVE